MAKSISKRDTSDTERASHQGAVVFVSEPPTVPSYYANNTQVETSFFDVCFKFGETIGIDKSQNITKARGLVWVRMSLQHARAVHAILSKQLENYEREFGPLPAPAARKQTEPTKP